MILGFKQHFDIKKKEPTYFREKILAGAGRSNDYIVNLTPPDGVKKFAFVKTKPQPHNTATTYYEPIEPKLHTLRADPHNRWKQGMSIQMVYRGPNYSILDHFNKGIPELEKLVSKQKIKISCTGMPSPNGYNPEIYWPKIVIDGKEIGYTDSKTSYKEATKNILQFVQNDGFETITDFCKWFSEDWEGYILHWTDLRY